MLSISVSYAQPSDTWHWQKLPRKGPIYLTFKIRSSSLGFEEYIFISATYKSGNFSSNDRYDSKHTITHTRGIWNP